MTPVVSPALRAAARRGGSTLVLGLLLLFLAWPATGGAAVVLIGLGAILVILGLVIIVTTIRTLTADR